MNKTTRYAVEAHAVSKVYWDGDRRLDVLRGIDFSAEPGEGVAILGPSGSGKTTLLNILSGLDRPTSGRVTADGRDLGSMSDSERASWRSRRVGFVFQFYHLMPELTARENVMLPGWVAGTGARQLEKRADELLAEVGLSGRAGHFPSELSGGECQRAALARALVNDPEILFCDEPTGNLDPETGGRVAELLGRLTREQGKTLVLVTHDEKLAKICGRIWKLKGSAS